MYRKLWAQTKLGRVLCHPLHHTLMSAHKIYWISVRKIEPTEKWQMFGCGSLLAQSAFVCFRSIFTFGISCIPTSPHVDSVLTHPSCVHRFQSHAASIWNCKIKCQTLCHTLATGYWFFFWNFSSDFSLRPDLTAEQTLSQRIAEFQMRLQYLESMYRARQEDVAILSQYISMPSPNNDGTNVTISGPLLDALSPETRSMLRNMSLPGQKLPSSLRLPTAFHFLPHLLDDHSSLRPAFLMSRGRQAVSMVLGVPTVKRDKQSYLMSTLHNIITNMEEDEQNETMIVVFVGETDIEYVQLVAKQIEVRFATYVESGLIEVLSPPAAYYPNMEKLKITLNDPPERVKWRSKQNLDFAFLMAYAQPKATFYVQLEDDILAKRGFVTIMKNFALEKTMRKDPWFVLDFCQLGFIGKYREQRRLTHESNVLHAFCILNKWTTDEQHERGFLRGWDLAGVCVCVCVCGNGQVKSRRADKWYETYVTSAIIGDCSTAALNPPIQKFLPFFCEYVWVCVEVT